MNIHYFHTFQTESELICSLFKQSEATFTAVSAENSRRLEALPAPDVILVDGRSTDTWHMHHDQGSRTACRLIADLRVRPRSAVGLASGPFDGRVFLDLALPSWDVLSNIVDTVTRCARALPHTQQLEHVTTPALDAIIRGDSVDERILTLLAFGMSDKEISSSLCLSNQTIRNRMSRMLIYGQFRNRTALAVHFLECKRTQILGRASTAPMSTLAD